MKRFYSIVMAAAGAMIFSALPVLAEEAAMGHEGRSSQKDECLLVAKLVVDNCPNQSDSLQGKSERLNREIAKGTDVYSPAELRTLQNERDEVQKIWSYVNNNEPSDSL